jgi:hypothetical protein
MYLQGGSAFTGRNGTAYVATTPQDFPPSDINLAMANGWANSSLATFPGLADVPQNGVNNPLGAIPQMKLAQTAIPFIKASSGSMANNGALTGLAALPATYSNGCYLWLPANAISSGSAAGWYFAVMSSTTAGTVYNLTYTSGQPYVPATPSQFAFVTTGPGAFTGVATAVTGPSFTLPANTMGPNGVLELAAVYGCAGSTNSKTVAIKLGSATIYTQTTTTAANVAALALLTCQNQGLTNSQVSNQTGSVGFSATGQTYSTQDTTTNLTLALSGTAIATENLIFDAFSATVTPG